jgi:hypothetical protein
VYSICVFAVVIHIIRRVRVVRPSYVRLTGIHFVGLEIYLSFVLSQRRPEGNYRHTNSIQLVTEESCRACPTKNSSQRFKNNWGRLSPQRLRPHISFFPFFSQS